MIRSVLFICLGNICRSPIAEGVLVHRLAAVGLGDRVTVDSAGIGGWHRGEPPDGRAIRTAAGHGVDISGQRARQVAAADFERFDLILAMDRSTLAALAPPPGSPAQIGLFLGETLGKSADVPDPYYGDLRDFESVFDLCDRGAAALTARIAAGVQAASG